MKPTISVQTKSAKVDIGAVLNDLAGVQVFVGIPEANASRKGEPVNNAQLIYIHTNGSPLKGISKRPVIEPAIEAKGNKEPIAEELELAAKAALDGDRDQVLRHLKRAGLTAQNAVRKWFTDPRNGWAPNSPHTIARKGSDNPLIDKDEMRKAITYVVKEN